MNKYLSACLLLCITPPAVASLGSGFYFSAGAGGGWLDTEKLTAFDLDYPVTYFLFPNPDLANEIVTENFENTAQYEHPSETVVAGRAAVGYLWNIFEGEPRKLMGAIYTINATFGFEFGYRLFDNTSNSHTEIELDTITIPHPPPPMPPPGCGTDEDCFAVFETATTEVKNEAFDLLAVARLPFTEDNKFALLLKGGVAYNINEVDTTLAIEADLSNPPPNYDKNLSFDTEKHDEFLPVLGIGLEYMLYAHFGVSAEYSAIMGSSHNADSQLLTGNIIFRL